MNQLRNKAFTIVELIVAVAVTVLMLLMINSLFNDTSRAVSAGIGLSDVIGIERAMVDQIGKDAAGMHPPENTSSGLGGGILIISNELITGARHLERFNKEGVRDVRADGVVWIVRRASAVAFKDLPVAPATEDTYDAVPPDKMDGNGTYVRIYYGHGLRTNSDGSGGAATVKDNGIANSWPLLRHALFFMNRDESVDPGDDPFWPHDVTNPAYVSAVGAFHDSGIQSSTTGGTLRDGYTDLADITYSSSGAPTNGVLFGNIAGDGNGAAIYAQIAVATPNTDDYFDQASKLIFSGNNRMRTNPKPTVGANTADPFPPSQMAQMHNLLTPNVSDFIVEFAADQEFDGQIDLAAGGDIKWYSALDPPSYATQFPVGHSKAGVDTLAPEISGGIIIFRHDYPEHWPHMLRIRYRLHDPRSSVVSEDPEPGTAASTKNGKWFEHIIRVQRGIQ